MLPGSCSSSCVIQSRSPEVGLTALARWKGSCEADPVGEQPLLVPAGIGPGGGVPATKFLVEETISITPAFRLALFTPKSKVRSLIVDRVRRPSGVTGQPQQVCISSKSSKT